MSNGLLASGNGNYCIKPFRRQRDLNMLQLLRNNFIHTLSSFTIKYKWLFRLPVCLGMCVRTKSLHLWTLTPLDCHISTHTPDYVHTVGLDVSCMHIAEFVVWEGEHHDPDTEAIHLLTVKHQNDTFTCSWCGWNKGVDIFGKQTAPAWIQAGENKSCLTTFIKTSLSSLSLLYGQKEDLLFRVWSCVTGGGLGHSLSMWHWCWLWIRRLQMAGPGLNVNGKKSSGASI